MFEKFQLDIRFSYIMGLFATVVTWILCENRMSAKFERTQAISLLIVSFTRVEIDFVRKQIYRGL